MNFNLIKPIIKENRWKLAIIMGFIVLSAVFTLLVPLWTKHLIEETLPEKSMPKLCLHIAIGMLLVLTLPASRFYRTFMKYKITNNLLAYPESTI